jgi:hypothetical protein
MSDFESEIKRLRKDIFIIWAILAVMGVNSFILVVKVKELCKTGIAVEPKVEVEILEKK